ncbi:hypothetical protein NHQ30_009324 [Ciborinia camelliae]|nr:hypothetical protein NHQ30_009324 [Ciborinia camelliae]
MRQPAPITGESMEKLIIQSIVTNTPINPDAPSRPDVRTEQHITIDAPDAIRHSSDPNRYLLNRYAPIGGRAIEISDIEADTYDDDLIQKYIRLALANLQLKDNETPVSRSKFLKIAYMLKELIEGMIKDRDARASSLTTLVYVEGLRKMEASAQVSGIKAPEMSNSDDEEEDEELIPKEIAKHIGSDLLQHLKSLLPAAKMQLEMNKLVLNSVEDLIDNKHRSISDAILSRGYVLVPPSEQSANDVSTESGEQNQAIDWVQGNDE